MRKAKEVKVINRWRADDFDGEIPIEGDDEEMLGTAMKIAASNMSGAISDAVESAPGPLMYFGFYGLGGAVS